LAEPTIDRYQPASITPDPGNHIDLPVDQHFTAESVTRDERFHAIRIDGYEGIELPWDEGYWGEHPIHGRNAWRREIERGNTLLGYWAWVTDQLYKEAGNAGTG